MADGGLTSSRCRFARIDLLTSRGDAGSRSASSMRGISLTGPARTVAGQAHVALRLPGRGGSIDAWGYTRSDAATLSSHARDFGDPSLVGVVGALPRAVASKSIPRFGKVATRVRASRLPGRPAFQGARWAP